MLIRRLEVWQELVTRNQHQVLWPDGGANSGAGSEDTLAYGSGSDTAHDPEDDLR